MSNVNRIVTRTIVAAELQVTNFLDIPYAVRPFTSLNQKHDIQAATLPDIGSKHATKYLAIGNRGHRILAGADGFPYTSPVPHTPADTALYGQIPWLVRPEDQDIPAVERAKYAHRKVILNSSGERRIAYYLLRLDHTNVTTQLLLTTIRDGVTNTVAFVHNSSNANPVPPEISPDDDTPALEQGDYLTAKAILQISLSQTQVDELLNVANELYDNDNYAIISEVALCAGVDKTIVTNGSSGTINFNEALQVQIMSFISTYHAMKFTNNGLTFSVDVGANEGLLLDVPQVI